MMDTVPAKDLFITMQDEVKLVWEHLPHSQRLAFLILARGEFGQLNDVSYHMAKAWKEEQW